MFGSTHFGQPYFGQGFAGTLGVNEGAASLTIVFGIGSQGFNVFWVPGDLDDGTPAGRSDLGTPAGSFYDSPTPSKVLV